MGLRRFFEHKNIDSPAIRAERGTSMRNDEMYDQENLMLYHICEICDKTELLTSEEGFLQGWDYPPKMGIFGVLSPRTCGDCSIEGTLWLEAVVRRTPLEELCPRHRMTLQRISDEPGSILPDDDEDEWL